MLPTEENGFAGFEGAKSSMSWIYAASQTALPLLWPARIVPWLPMLASRLLGYSTTTLSG